MSDSCTPRHLMILALTIVLSGAGTSTARGQTDQPSSSNEETTVSLQEHALRDLIDLDLEQLMEIPVTSVAGVARPLQDTPAAVFVITAEDIRRGGHLTIPDALRMVPGVQVGQISSNIWAISARGFNDRFSTKLLVLIDGRAVYNSLFSGVFWDVQDLVLENVDRIEVVRGPGATLWGANAVNGVINIVTKRARETRGLLVSGGGGNVHEGFGTVRYGAKVGDETHFRVYGKFFERDRFDYETGAPAPDDWDLAAGGFRFDFESDPDTTLTLEGQIYDGTIGSPVVTRSLTAPFVETRAIDTEVRGGHVLARVEHVASMTAGWHLQMYYDRAERERSDFLDDERDTFDIEFRHNVAGRRHAVIWGIGASHRRDETDGSLTLSFDPPDDRKNLYSAFVQDTIGFRDDRLSLMIGSKFEENDFTGFELQPSVRIAWTPNEQRTLWGAVSRAVRTPSRASEDLVLTSSIITPPAVLDPTAARLLGDPDIDSEELTAYELGARFLTGQGATVDIAGFYNDYDDLISVGSPTESPFDVKFSNGTSGDTFGIEITGRVDVTRNWRISGAYSFIDIELDGVDTSDEDTSPRNQLNVRSEVNFHENFELNAAAYFVDEVAEGDIDAYTRLDVGVAWRLNRQIDLAVWGQNLLEDGHVEFGDPFFVIDPIEVPRSFYAQLSLRF